MKTRPQLTDRSKQILVNLGFSFLILIALITLWAGCTEPTEPQQPIQDCIALDTNTFSLGIRGESLFPNQTFRLQTPSFTVDFAGDTATLDCLKYWRIIFDGSTVWTYCIANIPERATATFYGIYSPDSICGWMKGTDGTVTKATAHRVQ